MPARRKKSTKRKPVLESVISDGGMLGLSPAHGGMPSMHSSHSSSMRTTHYRGHEISVETSYKITMDGKDLPVHIRVLDSGQVVCHGLPNYAYSSILDLLKSLLDTSVLSRSDKDELGHANVSVNKKRRTKKTRSKKKLSPVASKRSKTKSKKKKGTSSARKKTGSK